MRVAIHDGDGIKSGKPFPNLPLLKIAAAEKMKGNDVEWFIPLMDYDTVYSSKVFTFTKRDIYLPQNAILGGTGYGLKGWLPDDI